MSAKTSKPDVIDWEPTTAPGAMLGLLALGDGKRRVVYSVFTIPAGELRGFRLRKIGGGGDRESDEYDVRVTAAGAPFSCECKCSQVSQEPCKHLRAVKQLVVSGTLSCRIVLPHLDTSK